MQSQLFLFLLLTGNSSCKSRPWNTQLPCLTRVLSLVPALNIPVLYNNLGILEVNSVSIYTHYALQITATDFSCYVFLVFAITIGIRGFYRLGWMGMQQLAVWLLSCLASVFCQFKPLVFKVSSKERKKATIETYNYTSSCYL